MSGFKSKPGKPQVLVCAQEEMQKEVSRQFALLADDTWHTVDAAQSVEAVESQVHPNWCAQLLLYTCNHSL